jgi:hypothetical protein
LEAAVDSAVDARLTPLVSTALARVASVAGAEVSAATSSERGCDSSKRSSVAEERMEAAADGKERLRGGSADKAGSIGAAGGDAADDEGDSTVTTASLSEGACVWTEEEGPGACGFIWSPSMVRGGGGGIPTDMSGWFR